MKAGAWTVKDAAIPTATANVNRDDGATLLFIGDLHLDHPAADRNAVARLLKRAMERDAGIVLLGDVFDVMQGMGDRRRSKAELRARYAGRDDYLTAVLEDITAFLEPYASHVWIVLDGNHESAVTRYNEVSLTKLLVHDLRRMGGPAMSPGYQSYALARLTFRRDTSVADQVVPFWISHGYGGGGEVTKGVNQAHRRAVTYPDARFVISGHIHSSYFVAHEQHRVTPNGLVYDVEQEHYVVGSWKNEHASGSQYHIEKGRGPRLPSGWWCTFYRARGDGGASGPERARWEFTRAIP